MPTAFILSAGRGERLRPLTDTLPKPLMPLGDTTLIDRHLARLATAGFNRAVINLHHLGEKIVAHLGAQRYGINLHYSHEAILLDTAGGIIHALPLLGDEPFLLISADIVTDFDYAQTLPLLAKMGNGHALAELFLLPPQPMTRPSFSADFLLDTAGRVHPAPINADGTTPQIGQFAGIAVCHPRLFVPTAQALPPNTPYPLKKILLPALDHGHIHAQWFAGVHFDCGTATSLKAAQDWAKKQN